MFLMIFTLEQIKNNVNGLLRGPRENEIVMSLDLRMEQLASFPQKRESVLSNIFNPWSFS
jgi:hypothetical protein